MVQSCGFTSGRAAGGIDVAGEGPGPVYAETLPPKDPYALRTLYDQPDGHGAGPNVPPLTLAHLEAAVNGASSHGGGWVPLVFHEICDQNARPDQLQLLHQRLGPDRAHHAEPVPRLAEEQWASPVARRCAPWWRRSPR